MGLSSRVVRKLPTWVRINPLDVMFVCMGIPSSLVSLVGVARSNALTNVLPWWGPKLWSASLLVGCVAWLVGLTSITENNGVLVLTRMPSLLLGLHLVSMACLTYAVVVTIAAGWAGLLPSVIYLVVAGGTWLRRVDLSSRVKGGPS